LTISNELTLNDLLLAETSSGATITNNAPTIAFSGSTFTGTTNSMGSLKVADVVVKDVDNDDVEYKVIYGLSGSLVSETFT
jgi:hypothetical protein